MTEIEIEALRELLASQQQIFKAVKNVLVPEELARHKWHIDALTKAIAFIESHAGMRTRADVEVEATELEAMLKGADRRQFFSVAMDIEVMRFIRLDAIRWVLNKEDKSDETT